MQGYGRDESAPTPGGMFATHFVGGRCIINNPFAALRQTTSSRRGRFIVPAYTYSPRIRNPFEMPSRNVRNVFILCMLHLRHAKVWFLRHKSMRVCQNVHILFLCTKPRLSQARALLFPKVFVPLGIKKISL